MCTLTCVHIYAHTYSRVRFAAGGGKGGEVRRDDYRANTRMHNIAYAHIKPYAYFCYRKDQGRKRRVTEEGGKEERQKREEKKKKNGEQKNKAGEKIKIKIRVKKRTRKKEEKKKEKRKRSMAIVKTNARTCSNTQTYKHTPICWKKRRGTWIVTVQTNTYTDMHLDSHVYTVAGGRFGEGGKE